MASVLILNNQILNFVIMKSFLTLVFALTFSSILFSQNSQKNFIDQPYIEVIGQAETEIIPNEIYVRIILSENVKKGRISIEKQENKRKL